MTATTGLSRSPDFRIPPVNPYPLLHVLVVMGFFGLSHSAQREFPLASRPTFGTSPGPRSRQFSNPFPFPKFPIPADSKLHNGSLRGFCMPLYSTGFL
jgi:hypothetical protein